VKTNKVRREPKAVEAALAASRTDGYVLRLFVAGATVRSRQAILRIRQLCEAELKGNYDLRVIDIYQQPGQARRHQIVATPTLIRQLPLPMLRFIGNLSNTAGLIVALNVIAEGKILP